MIGPSSVIHLLENAPLFSRPSEINSWPLYNEFLQYLKASRYYSTVRGVMKRLRTIRDTNLYESAIYMIHSVQCWRVRVNVKHKLEKKNLLERFLYYWERLKEISDESRTSKPVRDVDIFCEEKWYDKMKIEGYI